RTIYSIFTSFRLSTRNCHGLFPFAGLYLVTDMLKFIMISCQPVTKSYRCRGGSRSERAGSVESRRVGRDDRGLLMVKTAQSPAQLRSVFGNNLRQLVRSRGSISELARELDLNRTQMNRFLNSASFPRPDVLQRICTVFGVDARV